MRTHLFQTKGSYLGLSILAAARLLPKGTLLKLPVYLDNLVLTFSFLNFFNVELHTFA